MFRTKMFQLVEVVIGAAVVSANAQVLIPNQPQLQTVQGDKQVFVKGIETFTNQAVPVSPLTTANPVATPAQLKNAVLTLVVKGTENLKQIPLAILNRTFADQTTAANYAPYTWQLFLLKDIYEVDWSKSYITLVAAPSGQPYSYLLGVHYDYEA